MHGGHVAGGEGRSLAAPSPPDALAVARFQDDLERLTGELPERLGIAVSGGPDSCALLLLAHAALPGRIAAATVDHGLRAGAAREAAQVGRLCADLGTAHDILSADGDAPTANLQAYAREIRYRLLTAWAQDRGLPLVATAHHLDDQAETMLMRMARGAGVGGLVGIRPLRRGDDGIAVVRPLLGWRRSQLADICRTAGIKAVDDPSNRDERFDRTRARALLAATPWLDPVRLAASAAHLAEVEAALAEAARAAFAERRGRDHKGRLTLSMNPPLPREMQRRLLAAALAAVGAPLPLDGPKLMRLLDRLLVGGTGTLAGIKCVPGSSWSFAPAPPHRS